MKTIGVLSLNFNLKKSPWTPSLQSKVFYCKLPAARRVMNGGGTAISIFQSESFFLFPQRCWHVVISTITPYFCAESLILIHHKLKQFSVGNSMFPLRNPPTHRLLFSSNDDELQQLPIDPENNVLLMVDAWRTKTKRRKRTCPPYSWEALGLRATHR